MVSIVKGTHPIREQIEWAPNDRDATTLGSRVVAAVDLVGVFQRGETAADGRVLMGVVGNDEIGSIFYYGH